LGWVSVTSDAEWSESRQKAVRWMPEARWNVFLEQIFCKSAVETKSGVVFDSKNGEARNDEKFSFEGLV